MSAGEFSGRPLVADRIVGIREFDVDSLGRLRGVSHKEVWRPGVNEAKCNGGIDHWLTLGGYVSRAARTISVSSPGWSGSFEYDLEPDAGTVKAKKHQVAQLNCTCGFYAYTDDDKRSYKSGNTITGIIAGSGVATVGSRGFRVEQAEIVALVGPSRLWQRWRSFALWADRIGAWAIPLGLGLVMAGLSLGIPLATVSPWFLALLLLIPGGLATVVASFKGVEDDRSIDFDLVRRNYPDVPVYRSTRAAIKAHPLSTPPPPRTPSPDDEDFWTRSAK